MPGLFDNVFRPPRQRPFATPRAAPGPGWMQGGMAQGQGGPPAYGSDRWALQTGGPGAMIFREMARAMAGQKGGNVLGFLDPKVRAFSPEFRQYLAPQYQLKGKK